MDFAQNAVQIASIVKVKMFVSNAKAGLLCLMMQLKVNVLHVNLLVLLVKIHPHLVLLALIHFH